LTPINLRRDLGALPFALRGEVSDIVFEIMTSRGAPQAQTSPFAIGVAQRRMLRAQTAVTGAN
jgi:hypothetical protein